MQTPKTRAATLEVPRRTQKAVRQLKTSSAEVDKTPKTRSPKVVDRRSPRTPTSEKKRTGRITELETQLASLQEELCKSESLKKRANEELDEAKKRFNEMSVKLQDSQKRVDEILASEESRLQELRKISQDRDRAWESELEAVQKHHESEVQNLKMQLEKVVESEANQVKYAESVNDEVLKLTVELEKSKAKVDSLEGIVSKFEKPDDDNQVSVMQIESCKKVSILETNLKKLKEELEDVKAKLVEKEEKLQNITEENKILNEKLAKDTEDDTNSKKLEDMKHVLFERETELNYIKEENEKLRTKKNQENQEVLMKVSYLTEEVDKRDKKVERITEQMDLAEAANAKIEAELRRLKVQTDQWRKAAEAAAAMLSGANNGGKFVERTRSLDTRTFGGKLNLDDMEDESLKKKNGNMLKKFGGFMKGRR